MRAIRESTAIVVGSGPAGMACALALVKAGKDVLMLDVGFRLEEDRTSALKLLRNLAHEQWRLAGNSDFLKEGMAADLSGVPLKLSYGSKFPYRSVPAATPLEYSDAYLQVSLAYGGFSNTWGSSMLPYLQKDMVGWPITQDELAPHYQAVLEHVPMAGRVDELADVFPLYTKPSQPFSSKQAEALLRSLSKHKDALNQRGVFAGTSRIAVQQNGEKPCVQCGLCMFGCPHELIYSSAFTIEKLKQNPKFRYVPNVYVRRVQEGNGTVTVEGRDIETGETLSFSGERAFIGAGVVNTTAILLRSLEAFGRPVVMQDTTYFLQPCLRATSVPDVRRESLHTLTQAFIEIIDSSISGHTVHLQVYTYNDLFERALISAAGPLRHLLPQSEFLGRLFLLQGYLHSLDSPSMECTLEKTADGDKFRVRGRELARARGTVKKVQRKLLRIASLTGLIPLLPLMRPGDPGRSFHTGGTLPMSDDPKELQTDCLGRPKGFSRIHAVDSTTFPSIPATTITLASMANAHRIGANAWPSGTRSS